MKTILFSFFVVMALSQGCETTKSSTVPPTKKTISGINWYLKKIYLSSGNIDIDNPNAYIRFDPEKNSAGGRGGCNTFGSKCSINAQLVNFRNIFSTKMYCEKFQSQEDSFFRQLEKVSRFDVKDGKLLLYKADDLLLEFSK